MSRLAKRIIVVDNHPRVLNAVKYNLEMSDYDVFTAATLEEAHRILANEIIHLAIIDIRLDKEEQVEDISGFNLARQLPDYIPFIIFTAYEDKESIRKALGEVGAKAILNKREETAAAQLIEKVNTLFETSVNVNFGLQIEGPLELDKTAAALKPHPGTRPPAVEDVDRALRTLFYDAVKIHLSPLLLSEQAPVPAHSGAMLALARPQYEAAWGAPVVVKFSERQEIAREAHNQRAIAPFLGGSRLAVLEGEAYSRQIGGLVYRLIGAQEWENIRVFGELFATEPTTKIIDLLEHFFIQTFATLFADARRETMDLTTMYTAALKLTTEKVQTAVRQFHPQALDAATLDFPGLPAPLPNPLSWTLSGDVFHSFQMACKKCLCHGDLHSRNILVDDSGQFWLIDFARVANSHALRDFVELETDIKFSLLAVDDMEALLAFEEGLLATTAFGEEVPEIDFADGRLSHAYQIVAALRRIAAELLHLDADMKEYYIALLFHTLNILRLKHITPQKKRHALLAAALICQRLEKWPQWDFTSAARAAAERPSSGKRARPIKKTQPAPEAAITRETKAIDEQAPVPETTLPEKLTTAENVPSPQRQWWHPATSLEFISKLFNKQP